MFDILHKSLSAGVVTTSYPKGPAQVCPRARGRPEITFTDWKDARPAVAACPTGALACAGDSATRCVTLDLGASALAQRSRDVGGVVCEKFSGE